MTDQGCAVHGLAHPCEECAVESHLRDELAMAALPAVLREFHEGERAGEYTCPPDWREGVALDAYRLADAMLWARNAGTRAATPSLPDSPLPKSTMLGENVHRVGIHGYTAQQMREYARAAALAASKGKRE